MCRVDIGKMAVRNAIWEAYGKKDFYTQEPLEFRDMEIDHIIPIKNSTLLNEFILHNDKISFLEDYDIESLYNLVPTSGDINKRKSNRELQLHNVILFYELTKTKKALIEQKISEFKIRYKTDRLLIELKSSIESERNDLNIEKILNFITDDETFFAEEDYVFNQGSQLFLRKYGKRVGLVAKLPTINDVETSCSIYFRTRNVRDCIIELDNKLIVGTLFAGLNTKAEYHVRPYIEFEEMQGDGIAVVTMGTSRLRINLDDLNDFCDVVDFYGNLYLERIKTIESILETRHLKLSSRRNHYQLCEIDNVQWLKLVKFACKHDVDSGRSKWHIFDNNYYYIKVFTNVDSEKYAADYHSFFDSEYDKDILHYSEFASKKRIVTWGFIPNFEAKDDFCISKRTRWNATIAQDWFFNEYIPKVLGRKLRFKKQTELERIFSRSKVEPIEYLSDISINNTRDLRELVEKLQVHFNGRPHNQYRVLRQNYNDLLKALVLCFSRSEQFDLHYCSSKLGIHARDKNDLIVTLEVRISESRDTTFGGFSLDLIFRSLLTALDGTNLALSEDEILEIHNGLMYYIELSDLEILLEKYAINFIE